MSNPVPGVVVGARRGPFDAYLRRVIGIEAQAEGQALVDAQREAAVFRHCPGQGLEARAELVRDLNQELDTPACHR